jgi:hypothetical protein
MASDPSGRDVHKSTVESASELLSRVFGFARFRDCTHEHEPGCAVIAAAERGDLDADRLASYRKLCRELHNLHVRQDHRARQEETARWKVIHKSLRNHPKYRNW